MGEVGRRTVKTRIVVGAVAVALVGATVLGRILIGGTAPASTVSGRSVPSTPSIHVAQHAGLGAVASGVEGVPTIPASGSGVAGTPAVASSAGDSGAPSASSPSGAAPSTVALPAVPVFPTTPQIVRTATVDLRVGAGSVRRTLNDITTLASADGGYVESSSMTGGTTGHGPVSGSIVIHVVAVDFGTAISALSADGRVTSQEIAGKDVTDEVAANDGSLEVLQQEVALLESKLAQAGTIDTFLQIEDQLFPVENQLQQLQNEQTVLEGSAALATITVGLTAPVLPPATAPAEHAKADAVVKAWHYLRHNSLAVLDGLAVAAGWLLPAVVLAAIVWLVASRLRRRRRHAVNPA
ncbi:MAG: DUF4349 domain-containing protein [Acidimicrobiales bacterium]|jgi:hypothetical protein